MFVFIGVEGEEIKEMVLDAFEGWRSSSCAAAARRDSCGGGRISG